MNTLKTQTPTNPMKQTAKSGLAASVILAACCCFSQAVAGTARLYVVGATTNQVYRYLVASNTAPVLDFTLTDTNLSIPLGIAFSPEGEMFVGNRGSNPYIFEITPGYVQRYAQPSGMPAFNGTLGVGTMTTPHWLAFRGEELLVADSGNNRVRRYIFSGYGKASELPSITAGLSGSQLRGVIASPDGQYVFTSQCYNNNNVQRYRMEINGTITYLGVLPGPFFNSAGMAFSPWGELFVANPADISDGNTNHMFISRYTFTGDGTPQYNGSITHSNLSHPCFVAFSPWGELFVGKVQDKNVARFTFTSDHTAVANGQFSLPADVGQFAFEPVADGPQIPDLRLRMATSNTNAQFSFSTNAAAYTLEWADDIAPLAVWRPSYAPRMTDNAEFRLTLPVTNVARFFRLRCPAE
jgi:DNA-binding beta-propeller fold protein YncE